MIPKTHTSLLSVEKGLEGRRRRRREMEGLQYTQNSMPPSLRSLKRTLQLWADSCANKSFCFERNLYSQKMIFLAGMSFVFMIGDLWSVIHGAIEGPPPIKSDTHPPPHFHTPPTKKKKGNRKGGNFCRGCQIWRRKLPN